MTELLAVSQGPVGLSIIGACLLWGARQIWDIVTGTIKDHKAEIKELTKTVHTLSGSLDTLSVAISELARNHRSDFKKLETKVLDLQGKLGAQNGFDTKRGKS